MTERSAVQYALETLIAAGFALQSIDDGGAFEPVSTVDEALGHIFGVDDSYVIVAKNGQRCRFYVVLGNDPEGREVIADWDIPSSEVGKEFDSVMDGIVDHLDA